MLRVRQRSKSPISIVRPYARTIRTQDAEQGNATGVKPPISDHIINQPLNM